jgi:protein required for attachment to host cells
MSRIRIVVADQAEAVFYDAPSLEARPREVGRISDPLAHQHARDLASDRPGRSYESVGGARHAIERENDPRRQAALRFARRISCRLDDALQRGEFDELVVVAGPPFLGLVRDELSRPARQRVAREIRKDLVHGPVESLQRHLAAVAGELGTA